MASYKAIKAEVKCGCDESWQDKCRLLDEIDDLRGGSTRGYFSSEKNSRKINEVDLLKEKVRSYEATCELLEKEVQTLEEQNLAAVAEASNLRRALQESEKIHKESCYTKQYLERKEYKKIVQNVIEERKLLVEALIDSEMEISRMSKTLDIVVRKLQEIK